jgi:hypothetical protein
MLKINDLLKAYKINHLIFGIFLILYILINIRTPSILAKLIDNIYGNIVLVVVVINIFVHTNYLVGILSAIAAYKLVVRSSVTTGTYGLAHYLPSENSKVMDFSKFNDFPVTLEEEVVAKMAPLVKHDDPSNIDYKPVLDGLHDAAPIDYEGVI